MTVSTNLSVLRIEQGTLRWWQAGDSTSRDVPPVDGLPDNTVLALPSDAVRLGELAVSQAERKHLRKSLPFLLEEDVIDDVAALHCVYGGGSDGIEDTIRYGVTTRACMDDWARLLPEHWEGPWIPESLLLPVNEGELCLVVETDSVLVRSSAALGARVPKQLLAPLLNSLATPPETVLIYGQDQHDDLALLPPEWIINAQWRRGGFGQALLLSGDHSTLLDLRQGDYAPRLPFQRWWGHWRQVAMAAAAALVLHLGADAFVVHQLERDNMALRAAIQASYRQANPRGAVVDPEKQLDRQLAEYQVASSGTAFTPLLATITQAVASEQGLSISSLNFNATSSEIRLDLIAENYALVEKLRQRLQTQDMTATLETSSSRDDRVRARLRIVGGRV